MRLRQMSVPDWDRQYLDTHASFHISLISGINMHGNTAMLVEFDPGHEVNVADHIVATGVNKLPICFGSVHVREQGLFQSIARKLTRGRGLERIQYPC